MSRIKTIVSTGLATLTLAAPLNSATDISLIFAGCAGRFSAEMEHAWLLGSDEAETYQDQRLTFVSLLDATVAQDRKQRAMNYRIEAKLAHAALLSTASFSDDLSRATRARAAADQYLVSCKRLLLDS